MEQLYKNIPEIKIYKQNFIVDDLNIGYFEYSFIENDCIYIEYVYVYSEYRGKGYGDKLIELMNNFIKSEGKFGILQNSLNSDYIYKKNKWEKTENSIFLVYNTKINFETKDLITKIINYQI